MTESIIIAACSLIVLPWCVWVSVSIFTQRQEVALLKQDFHLSKEIYSLLKERLTGH